MMQINKALSQTEASSFLQECAKFAYGSGTFEGRSGGAGNIGMLGGHVVKFRTHMGERSGEVTKEMADSCVALKDNLIQSLQVLLSRNGMRTRAEAQFLEEIKNDLGLQRFQANGTKDQKAKSLLDRKVVAKVLNKYEKLTKTEVFNRESGAYAEVSSKNVNTQFPIVRKRALVDQLNGMASRVNNLDTFEKDKVFEDGILDILSQPEWKSLVRGSLEQSQDRHVRRLYHPVTGPNICLEDSRSAEKKCATLNDWLTEVQDKRSKERFSDKKFNVYHSNIYDLRVANKALAAILEFLDDMQREGFNVSEIREATKRYLDNILGRQQEDFMVENYPQKRSEFNKTIEQEFGGEVVV